jgi:hypothetical protein
MTWRPHRWLCGYVEGVVTFRVNVAVCIKAPDVAVTVTVAVSGVDVTGVAGAPPPLLCCVVGEDAVEEVRLHAVNRVRVTIIIGSNIISCELPRLLLPTKHRARASDEPESNRPEVLVTAADATAVTVSVETRLPAELTVTEEKLHVVPLGNPEQVNATGEDVEKPFCGVMVTVVVPLVPAAIERVSGETARVKSCAGAPAA